MQNCIIHQCSLNLRSKIAIAPSTRSTVTISTRKQTKTAHSSESQWFPRNHHK
jgi:hypothetical protein